MPVFNRPDVLVNRNRIVFPEFDYLKRNLLLNNNRIAAHMRKRTIYIPNSNLLNQLLYALPERDEHETDLLYHQRVSGIVYGMYTAYGLVHEGGYGGASEGTIYSGISEYFIAAEEPYVPTGNGIGIDIISHPYVSMTVPQFTDVTTTTRISKPREQYAYFSINLPLLVLNYSKYVITEQAKLKPNETLGNPINKFLQDIVYPSLVIQHNDIAFFNGLSQLLTGERLLEPKGFTDISLPDFSRKADDLVDDYFEFMTSNASSLDQILQMELPSGKIIWDLMLDQHDKLQTTNWFYYMANHRYYAFILMILGVTGIKTDNDLIGSFKYELKGLSNFSSVFSHMDAISKEKFKENIRLLNSFMRDL